MPVPRPLPPPTSRPPLRVSGPAELIALLPYQLGFHPSRSLVAVSIREDASIALVQRIDLPPPELAGETADALVTGLRRSRCRSVLLVGFEDRPGDAEPLLSAAAAVCHKERVTVLDSLVVRADRWRSAGCADRDCCPPEGRPVARSADVGAVASFVAAGTAPLADRAALDRALAPSRPLLLAAVADAVACLAGQRLDDDLSGADMPSTHGRTLATRRAEDLRRWGDYLDGPDIDGFDIDGFDVDGFDVDGFDIDGAHRGGQSSTLAPDSEAADGLANRPDHLAALAVSLVDRDLRDVLLARLCPGWLDLEEFEPSLAEAAWRYVRALPDSPATEGTGQTGETVDPAPHTWAAARVNRVQDRLVALCASLPEGWTPGPLTMLAWVAWWRGDGAMARVAVERALRADPCYRLAQLVDRMLDLAVRPGELSGRRDDEPTGGLMAV